MLLDSVPVPCPTVADHRGGHQMHPKVRAARGGRGERTGQHPALDPPQRPDHRSVRQHPALPARPHHPCGPQSPCGAQLVGGTCRMGVVTGQVRRAEPQPRTPGTEHEARTGPGHAPPQPPCPPSLLGTQGCAGVWQGNSPVSRQPRAGRMRGSLFCFLPEAWPWFPCGQAASDPGRSAGWPPRQSQQDCDGIRPISQLL